MDDSIPQKSMKLFEPIGKIKSRSMFGGFGIFANDIMFALVINNKLHIRDERNEFLDYETQNMKPYVYKKSGFPVITKYYAIPECLWETPDKLLSMAQKSFMQVQQKKHEQVTAKPERLKDLPNLRLATERMLKKAGINSVNQLEKEGAINAYKAIQSSHSSNISLELLWSLEGAIEGTHWSVIPESRRQELIENLNI